MKKIENIQIIFVDIDGTLTNSNKKITSKTKEVIGKIREKGMKVILCSGRPNFYTIEKSKFINGSSITISNSGNLVYDYQKNKVISINKINKNNLIDIYNYCEKNNLGCSFNGVLKVFQNKYSFRSGVIIESIEEIDEPICQLCVSAYTLNDALKFQNYISKSDYFKISYISKSVLNKEENAESYNFDVIYKNIDKGYGIRVLLEYLNISSSKALCFGDYINDYSMFKECKISVAMANSSDELKELADYITLSNDEDGVAIFLENNLL